MLNHNFFPPQRRRFMLLKRKFSWKLQSRGGVLLKLCFESSIENYVPSVYNSIAEVAASMKTKVPKSRHFHDTENLLNKEVNRWTARHGDKANCLILSYFISMWIEFVCLSLTAIDLFANYNFSSAAHKTSTSNVKHS